MGYTPEVDKQVHVSLNADMGSKAKHPRWESGSFVCVEVPTSNVDLDCFDVLPGTEHDEEIATPAPCAAHSLEEVYAMPRDSL